MVKIRHLGRALLGLAVLLTCSTQTAKADISPASDWKYMKVTAIGDAVTSVNDLTDGGMYLMASGSNFLRQESDGYVRGKAFESFSSTSSASDLTTFFSENTATVSGSTTYMPYVFKLTKSDTNWNIMAYNGAYMFFGWDTWDAATGYQASWTIEDTTDGLNFYSTAAWSNVQDYLTSAGKGDQSSDNAGTFVLFPVTTEQMPTVDITYSLVDENSNAVTDADGNEVKATVATVIGSETSIPDAIKRGYCSYSFTSETASAATTAATVTLTGYSLPFTVSTDVTEGATWYRMKIRSTKYSSYTSTSENFDDVASEDNPTTGGLFAFTGSPYKGFQIYNCAAGVDKNLGLDDNSIIVPSTTTTLWRLCEGTRGAYFKIEGSDHQYINDMGYGTIDWSSWTYSNYRLGIWDNKDAASDAGSALSFEAVDVVDLALNTVGSKSYATTCLPFNVSAVTNATPHTGALDLDNSTLTLTTTGGTIPANNGVVLVSDNASTTATLTIGDASALTNTNDLKGTCVALTNNNYLTLGLITGEEDSSTEPGFYTYTGTTIHANRAYLEVPSSATIRIKLGDETTGINAATIFGGESNAPVYDLSGRRVATPVKGGIYMQGGKKFIK